VMNLGHNPTRWWRRVLDYLGLAHLAGEGEFCPAVTLNAYNSLVLAEWIKGELRTVWPRQQQTVPPVI